MEKRDSYLKERYEKFELESQIESLDNEIKTLKNENSTLKKGIKYLKSTKALKLFSKFLKLRGKELDIDKKSHEIKNLKDIKVALLSDQFTYDSYKYEFKPVSILPDNWMEQFEQEQPDIFFCESAWDGHNFEGLNGPWHKKVYKDFTCEGENRTVLLEIIKYCKKHSIPSVFWNKEDPPHYRDERISFAETAKNFDYIFTSSEECIKQYKKDFNHDNVNLLMFAGQPKLFNPLSFEDEIDEIVFAGSYYENHKERAKLMEYIFDKLIDNGMDLLIFDRQYYKSWGRYPERYDKYVLPPIEFREIPKIYKRMKWGLNFNIVTNSKSMFARRVFELALSNVGILTNYSSGVDEIFGDNVFVFDRDEELPDFTKSHDDKKLNNLYNVLEHHTYKQRWKQILDTIGFDYYEDKEEVTVIYYLDDLNKLDNVINNFNEINYENKFLKLLISKNISEGISADDLKKKFSIIDEIYYENKDGYEHIKNDLNTEFWILSTEMIDCDFIKKALLHYQYLNKRVSVCEGSERFTISVEDNFENKLISRYNEDVLTNPQSIDVYYI